MIDFLASMTEWHWLVLGVLLVVAEIAAPGTFLLWPGLAAIIVGLVKALAPGIAWTTCVGIWAVLSVVSVAGFAFYRKGHPSAGREADMLNSRGSQYVGQRYTLATPVENGKGEMKVDDTVWRIISDENLPAGTVVQVAEVQGTALKVTRA